MKNLVYAIILFSSVGVADQVHAGQNSVSKLVGDCVTSAAKMVKNNPIKSGILGLSVAAVTVLYRRAYPGPFYLPAAREYTVCRNSYRANTFLERLILGKKWGEGIWEAADAKEVKDFIKAQVVYGMSSAEIQKLLDQKKQIEERQSSKQ